MSQTDLWLTREFVRRAIRLDRTRLRDLYPSEAWSLYRVIPQCRTVLDLGCGSGAMSQIVRAISPTVGYRGVDVNPDLIRLAGRRYAGPGIRFHRADLWEFLEQSKASCDCVMAWAVLYADPEFEALIERMLARANRFVLFDMRVAGTPDTIADMRQASTAYGGVQGPYVIASFPALLAGLRRHAGILRRVEVAGYDFPVGPTVRLRAGLPRPSVVSVLLERGRPGRKTPCKTEWHVKVPSGLLGEGRRMR